MESRYGGDGNVSCGGDHFHLVNAVGLVKGATQLEGMWGSRFHRPCSLFRLSHFSWIYQRSRWCVQFSGVSYTNSWFGFEFTSLSLYFFRSRILAASYWILCACFLDWTIDFSSCGLFYLCIFFAWFGFWISRLLGYSLMYKVLVLIWICSINFLVLWIEFVHISSYFVQRYDSDEFSDRVNC